jgi:hypothetical protein
MADTAASPNVASVIAAAQEQLQKSIQLPSGWLGTFSLRMGADSASVMFSWKPAESASVSSTSREVKGKKKRSKAKVERSANRARSHRENLRRHGVLPQQQPQLSPAAQPFVSNSVTASRGRDSDKKIGSAGPERSVIVSEQSSRVTMMSGPVPPPPPPPPHPGLGGNWGGWQVVPGKRGREEMPVVQPSEEVRAACKNVTDRFLGTGDQRGLNAAVQELDSLTHPRFAKMLVDNLRVDLVRRGYSAG